MKTACQKIVKTVFSSTATHRYPKMFAELKIIAQRDRPWITRRNSLNNTEFAATMLPDSRNSWPPSKSATRPPASRTSRIPAAMSHGLSPISQNPSKRPAATCARSRVAAPALRMPDAFGNNARNVFSQGSIFSIVRTGKPVPKRARSRCWVRLTLILRSLRWAPCPRLAVNNSSRNGS